jgi:hypothetical protein
MVKSASKPVHKSKSLDIPTAKFCKREWGKPCPGNCNICVLQYLMGQTSYL